MTATSLNTINDQLISNLKENEISYDVVRYKYSKLRGKEFRCYLLLIQIFENFVNERIESNIVNQKDKEIKHKVNDLINLHIETI